MTQTKISDNILESTFIPSLTVVKDSPNFPISFEVKETNPSTSRPQSYSKENTDYTSTSFDRQTVTKIRTFTTSSVAVIEIECTHTSSLTFMETVLFPSSSTLKIGTLVDITPSVTPTVSTSQSLVQKGIEATSVSIRELNSTSYTQFVTTLSSETSSIIPTELTHVWRNSSPTNEAISIASYYKNQSSIIHFITEAASATLISTETARITPGSETLNYVNLTPSSTSYINPYPISTNNNTLLTMNENPITFTETLVSTSTFPILDHLTTTETTSLVSASIESGSLSATVPTAVVNTSEISPLSTSSPTPMEKPSLRDLKRRGISALSKPSKSSEKDTTLDPKVIGPNGQLPTRSRKDAKNGRRRLFLKHHGFHMDFPVVRW
ncbi:hypothetical protein HMI54_005550 [Coelomomyces lativittatus]|nr:hypothetical protein HMI56_004562 [Coelomomyces lativittatus]KAJ1505942.1 hypothetical protein HMI54_005550 [Coelomomyces lativittatus]